LHALPAGAQGLHGLLQIEPTWLTHRSLQLSSQQLALLWQI
jgi:hypothetical protein